MNSTHTFKTNCLPLLIGSVPHTKHLDAMVGILQTTPEIPLWPQLPKNEGEGMIAQYASGIPGLDLCEGTLFVNGEKEDFDTEFLSFYEEYLSITEGKEVIGDDSRFALPHTSAQGFFTFLDSITALPEKPLALKGQTTGPFGIGADMNPGEAARILYGFKYFTEAGDDILL